MPRPAPTDWNRARAAAQRGLQRGRNRLAGGDPNGAVEAYEAGVAAMPTLRGLCELGLALHRAGNDVDAHVVLSFTDHEWLPTFHAPGPGVEPAEARVRRREHPNAEILAGCLYNVGIVAEAVGAREVAVGALRRSFELRENRTVRQRLEALGGDPDAPFPIVTAPSVRSTCEPMTCQELPPGIDEAGLRAAAETAERARLGVDEGSRATIAAEAHFEEPGALTRAWLIEVGDRPSWFRDADTAGYVAFGGETLHLCRLGEGRSVEGRRREPRRERVLEDGDALLVPFVHTAGGRDFWSGGWGVANEGVTLCGFEGERAVCWGAATHESTSWEEEVVDLGDPDFMGGMERDRLRWEVTFPGDGTVVRRQYVDFTNEVDEDEPASIRTIQELSCR
ncbi:MAG: hypothetical protein R3B82_16405 [Sandaracinaceae bacterium]